MKNYIISEALGNSILSYLTKRPYEEVAVLIAQLQAIQELKPTEVKQEATSKKRKKKA